MTLTNLEVLRLVARAIPRLPDARRGRDVAVLALQAITAPTDAERDVPLRAARRLLREALPPDDPAA
jgi:hypothetical protein